MKIFEKNLFAQKYRVMSMALASLLIVAGCEFGTKKAQEPSVIVVNVLAKELYDDCHIPGSIHVDFEHVMDTAKGWSKSAKIVIYCANYACTASASAARSLRAEGFDAYEYAAGMAGWLQAGLPVVGNAQSPYLHQANEPHEEAVADVPVISTEELKALLDEKVKE